METINVTVNGRTLQATLLRETEPRIAIAQDRIVLLNKYNRVMATADLLELFDLGQISAARQSNEGLPQYKKPLSTDRKPKPEVKLNGDMANQFNESQDEMDAYDHEFGTEW